MAAIDDALTAVATTLRAKHTQTNPDCDADLETAFVHLGHGYVEGNCTEQHAIEATL